MNVSNRQLPVLIIGGGIGGLILALELAQHNIPAIVFEKTKEFEEFGAGLQLSPNAVTRLQKLGLGTALEAHVFTPSKISIHDALSGQFLNDIPLGSFVQKRYDAPYWVIARKDLQAILLSALSSYPTVSLFTGHKFANYRHTGSSIVAIMDDGLEYEGKFLVGADGVWSRTRHLINNQAIPTASGYIAWRALIPLDQAPSLLRDPATKVWLGPHSHLVHYRISGGDKLNLVAVTKGKSLPHSWAQDLPKEQLFEHLRPWDADIRAAVMGIEQWTAWPLMILKPFMPWGQKNIVLIGDAAHAIVPFLAQGAAMAIEDAQLLALLINKHSNQLEKVPPLFQAERFGRCKKILAKSLLNAKLYHASENWRPIRNLGIKAIPAHMLLRQYDWIYEG